MILLLTAAFVVPRMYDWNPYRERMEQIASEALGADVRISGDLSFTLLPQPQMRMSQIVVGPDDAPIMEIESVEANLALMQFLRDYYDVQRLILNAPTFYISVAKDGGFAFPIALAQGGGRDNVSVEDAQINEADIFFKDERTNEQWSIESVYGNLSVQALRGPFEFNGNGKYDGRDISLRINTSDLNDQGDIRLSGYLNPEDKSYSIATEGVLSTASLSPFYDGEITVRVTPTKTEDDVVRGDMVLDGKVQLDPTRFKLTEFALQPDENRAGTRVNGAIDIRLGEERSFDAVVSGGVVSLLPANVLSKSEEDPYALVDLLTKLPAPPAFGNISGHLSVDITELGLRSISLRDVRLDATTDGQDWQIETLSAKLPGDSDATLSGSLIDAQGQAAFDGTLSLSTDRLDALARTWRAFGDSNPLFGARANLATNFSFSSSGATLENFEFDLDGAPIIGTVDWREEDQRRLSIKAELGAFDRKQTAQLQGLLPDPNRADRFANSFPVGLFDVSIDQFDFGGLPASLARASGDWSGSGVQLGHFAIEDVASIRLEGNAELVGDILSPMVSGALRADLNPDADVAALWDVLPLPDLHPNVATIIQANRPARFDFSLSPPKDGNAQKLLITSGAGELTMNAEVELSEGLAAGFTSPSQGQFEINAPSAQALFEQLGVDGRDFDQNAAASLRLKYAGTVFNSVEVNAQYSSEAQVLGYEGSLIVSDLHNLRGTGKINAKLNNGDGFSGWMGMDGFTIPSVEGTADLRIAGAKEFTLSKIRTRVGDETLSGFVTVTTLGDNQILEGDVKLGRIDLSALSSFLGGSASTLNLQGNLWPDGPFALASKARYSRGRIKVSSPLVLHDGSAVLTDTEFDLSWTQSENRIRNLRGARGEGEVSADITLCCYGSSEQKQVSGRFTLDSLSFDDIFADAVSQRMSGYISGSGQFSGVGSNYAEAMSTVGGDGSFSVSDLEIQDFDPSIFQKIIAIENILELEAPELEAQVISDLNGASYSATEFEGLFSLAGGKMLINNIAIEDVKTRLFGGASLNLNDLALESGWTLTPTQNVGDGSILNESTGRVDATIAGSLSAPAYSVDIQQMVDSIRVKAFELEVERLEILRAEQEARTLAQAEEQQRRMAEQAAQLARDEAEKAARLDAERKARIKAEAEARAAAAAAVAADEAAARELNTNSSTIQLPGAGADDEPLLLFDPNELLLDDSVPIDLIEGSN